MLELAASTTRYGHDDLLQKLALFDVKDPITAIKVALEPFNYGTFKGVNTDVQKDARVKQLNAVFLKHRNAILANRALTARYLATLTEVLESNVEPTLAITKMLQTLAEFRPVLGRISLEEATIQDALSLRYRAVENFSDALNSNAIASQMHTQLLGPDHEQVESDLNSKGKILVSMGQIDAGLAAYREAIVHAERFGEARYPAVAAISLNLGIACLYVKQDAQCAREALLKAVTLGTKAWGPNN